MRHDLKNAPVAVLRKRTQATRIANLLFFAMSAGRHQPNGTKAAPDIS
jgi:hypothetical protein